jgi:hypothetical protein
MCPTHSDCDYLANKGQHTQTVIESMDTSHYNWLWMLCNWRSAYWPLQFHVFNTLMLCKWDQPFQLTHSACDCFASESPDASHCNSMSWTQSGCDCFAKEGLNTNHYNDTQTVIAVQVKVCIETNHLVRRWRRECWRCWTGKLGLWARTSHLQAGYALSSVISLERCD